MIKPAAPFPSLQPTRLHTPVLIVTGFLGAGKTTFLKNYLHATDTKDIRIGLVRNEFTQNTSNIFEEPLLLDESDSQAFKSFIEFPNTCVCCSARSQFLQAVTRLAEIGFEENRPFKLILVEVSGLTDPTVIAEEIFTAVIEDNTSPIKFGGVLAVVDTRALIDTAWFSETKHQHEIEMCDSAKEIGEKVPDSENILDSFKSLLTRQISASDIILLNKIDLVEHVGIVRLLKTKIQNELNQLAVIKEVSYSELGIEDLMVLLDHKDQLMSESKLMSEEADQCSHVLDCINVDQVEVNLPQNIRPRILEDKLNRYIWGLEESGSSLLRGKGILVNNENGVNSYYSIQIVRGVVDISQLNNSSTLLLKYTNSMLMLIGIGLNRQTIYDCLISHSAF